MPTYDYVCRKCGFENEYRNVSSDSHPACEGCGSDKNMHRLPSRIRIGTEAGKEKDDDCMHGRKVTADDFTGTVEGLEIRIGLEKCKDCGGMIPTVEGMRHFKCDKGPSVN